MRHRALTDRAVMAVLVLLATVALMTAPAAWAEDPPPGSYPVTLPPQTFQAVVSYLKRQPWEDVQPLMAALAQAAQASMPAQEKPPDHEAGPKAQ